MGFYADSWLREARDRVGAYPEQPGWRKLLEHNGL